MAVKRPSKKSISEAVAKLKEQSSGSTDSPAREVGKPSSKKSSMRIRKQGV